MKLRVIVFFVVINLLFFAISYYLNKNKEFEALKGHYDFYRSGLKWRILDKYIDTNEHMGRNLIVTPLTKDSQFMFMPSSNRLSYTLFDQIEIGDTIYKRNNSLTITITNGYKKIVVESDTAFITSDFLEKFDTENK